jgi:hypothetical protein
LKQLAMRSRKSEQYIKGYPRPGLDRSDNSRMS